MFILGPFQTSKNAATLLGCLASGLMLSHLRRGDLSFRNTCSNSRFQESDRHVVVRIGAKIDTTGFQERFEMLALVSRPGCRHGMSTWRDKYAEPRWGDGHQRLGGWIHIACADLAVLRRASDHAFQWPTLACLRCQNAQ